jgi:hypothetical protein
MSPQYQQGVHDQGPYGAYWSERFNKTLMPDNMGSTWIASSTCDQVYHSVEGAWLIYAKSGNLTYLSKAYDLYYKLMVVDNTIGIDIHRQKVPYSANPKAIIAIPALAKMAAALGKQSDAEEWLTLYNESASLYSKKWGRCGTRYSCDDSIVSYGSAQVAAPYVTDERAAAQSKAFLMNDVTGHFPPNASYGAILLATPLNESTPSTGPWIAHTTYTYEAIDGLFRHDVYNDAVQLATGHIRDMQRTYGFTIFPEAWSVLGGPWGDQWYNWGSCASINLVLDRLCGVDYTATERAPGAAADGILTIRDSLPEDWARAAVVIPMANGIRVNITVARLNATAKRITVHNNPLGALRLEPWIGKMRKVLSVSPPGAIAEKAGNRLDWLFVGADAKQQSVVVVWEEN